MNMAGNRFMEMCSGLHHTVCSLLAWSAQDIIYRLWLAASSSSPSWETFTPRKPYIVHVLVLLWTVNKKPGAYIQYKVYMYMYLILRATIRDKFSWNTFYTVDIFVPIVLLPPPNVVSCNFIIQSYKPTLRRAGESTTVPTNFSDIITLNITVWWLCQYQLRLLLEKLSSPVWVNTGDSLQIVHCTRHQLVCWLFTGVAPSLAQQYLCMQQQLLSMDLWEAVFMPDKEVCILCLSIL